MSTGISRGVDRGGGGNQRFHAARGERGEVKKGEGQMSCGTGKKGRVKKRKVDCGDEREQDASSVGEKRERRERGEREVRRGPEETSMSVRRTRRRSVYQGE